MTQLEEKVALEALTEIKGFSRPYWIGESMTVYHLIAGRKVPLSMDGCRYRLSGGIKRAYSPRELYNWAVNGVPIQKIKSHH